MNNFAKFILLAIPALSIGVYNSHLNYQEPVNKYLDAWVYSIDWESRNHGMPLIMLKRSNNTAQKFHHERIILTSNDIKVGDHLVKESGSKECTINGKLVLCLK